MWKSGIFAARIVSWSWDKEIDSFDREDDEHYSVCFVKISRIFAMKAIIFIETEPFGRDVLSLFSFFCIRFSFTQIQSGGWWTELMNYMKLIFLCIGRVE